MAIFTTAFAQVPPLTLVAKKQILVLDTNSMVGKQIYVIKQNEKFYLLWYSKSYFKTSNGTRTGFIKYSSIKDYVEVEPFKQKWNHYNDSLKKLEQYQRCAEEKSERHRQDSIRLAEMVAKFGAYDGERVAKRQIWIGMTKAHAVYGIGAADDINRSNYGSVVHEQWVYREKKLYLYFEGDKLTAYQN